MTHPHGLISLNPGVNTVLSTLASKAALTVDQTLAGLTSAFLLKRVRYMLDIENVVAGEGPLIVGLAQGDLNDAEIAAGMIVTNTVGPEDMTQVLTQDNAWKILRATLERAIYTGDGIGDLMLSGRWHNMPGRGIPFPERSGIRAFVFNADVAALADTNTAVCKGLIEYQGVWLNG